jgi:hypothetical protein
VNAERRAEWAITFGAVVQAEEVRFDALPNTDVKFTGCPSYESETSCERINLPGRVRDGVTYRDIRVHYRLACELAEAPSLPRGAP